MRRAIGVAFVASAFIAGVLGIPFRSGARVSPSLHSQGTVDLDFSDIAAGVHGSKLSDSVRGLNGRRVRMRGYVAHFESPLMGSFYLVPRPLRTDETMAGKAELPLETVLVMTRSMVGPQLPHIDGALDVTGILDVGAEVEENGLVSWLRLNLKEFAPAESPVASNAARLP